MVTTRTGKGQTKLDEFTEDGELKAVKSEEQESDQKKAPGTLKRPADNGAVKQNKKSKHEEKKPDSEKTVDTKTVELKKSDDTSNSSEARPDKDKDVKQESTQSKATESEEAEKEADIKEEADSKATADSKEIGDSSETGDSKSDHKDKRTSEPVTTLKKSDDTDDPGVQVKINRAPVLDLYASCAAQLQHPNLSWKTCLSIGSAISSMCALSKGRAIGQIAPSTHAQENHYATIRVMGFEVPLKDDVAYVGDTKKPANEGYLKSRFGEHYNLVKSTMQLALESWSDDVDAFDSKGFHLYERFRPGSGGWGEQGALGVKAMERIITR